MRGARARILLSPSALGPQAFIPIQDGPDHVRQELPAQGAYNSPDGRPLEVTPVQIGLRLLRPLMEMGREAMLRWTKEEAKLDAVDLPGPAAEWVSAVRGAGLAVGSVDAPAVGASLSADAGKRREAVEQIKRTLDAMAEQDLHVLFVCLIPEDRTQPRRETFRIWAETYPEIVAHAEARQVRLAMEPYPGPGPHYPTIGCTPEMYQRMFAVIDSPSLGICYDPSHYVRLGIDYLRVLDEFGNRVVHVHGKDTELLPERQYEQGYLGPTFDNDIGWSGGYWRYCIPGHGEVNWAKVAFRLRAAGYQGTISIELEDHLFARTLPGAQEGIRKAAAHLAQYFRA